LNAAGVGPQYLNALPQATYEGDFVVLSIQVGTSILKACAKKMLQGVQEDSSLPTLGYLFSCDPISLFQHDGQTLIHDFRDHGALLRGIERRANFVHFSTAQKFQEAMQSHGSMNANAIDEVKLEMMRMTYAHAYALYARFFYEQLQTLDREDVLHETMAAQYELFCLTVMDASYERGGGFGEFVAAGVLSPLDYGRISTAIKSLLKTIRPSAVGVVDAWNIPDFLLNSCLGRYDGRVYEALYEQTLYEPLNKTDIADGYFEHLQYIMHPERRAEQINRKEKHALAKNKVQSKL